jgi:hypothetical protein
MPAAACEEPAIELPARQSAASGEKQAEAYAAERTCQRQGDAVSEERTGDAERKNGAADKTEADKRGHG